MTIQPTVWPSATSQGALSASDAALYLERIGLPELDASSPPPPSLDLLRQLQSSHILAVPFESTTLHCSNWHADDDEIRLQGGHPVALGASAFNRIVRLRRGGYCFSVNGTFALLLRFFGFRVSELAARVFASQGKDPEENEVGWAWSPTSHQCAVVDWEGSEGRWFVDVGFGSAQSVYPIPFHDGATQNSLPPSELFTLRRYDTLPLSTAPNPVDPVPYWVLHHKEAPGPEAKSYWSPVYAFTLATVAYPDFAVYNHYNSTHPSAAFTNFFVCTRLSPDGSRTTLYWKEGTVEESSCRRMAKLQFTPAKGDEGVKKREEWVEMRVGPVRRVLEEHFGMLFPKDHSGN